MGDVPCSGHLAQTYLLPVCCVSTMFHLASVAHDGHGDLMHSLGKELCHLMRATLAWTVIWSLGSRAILGQFGLLAGHSLCHVIAPRHIFVLVMGLCMAVHHVWLLYC